MKKLQKHSHEDITRAATLFFMVRGLVRTKLAEGRKLDPFAWLRIETLVYIRDNDGPSMRAVANHLSITAPSATSLVSALERAGLVSRKPDANDRRALRVYLTKKGEKTLAAAVAHGMDVFGKLFVSLSSAELEAFTKALEGIHRSGSR